MPSILSGYEYDIFISYRHNDNLDGWVTQFVENLEKELRATLKETLTIYFDENPHDGLQHHHEVDGSLKEKLRSLILIPVVSRTYCDPNAFAWEHELLPFISQASKDSLGLKTRVSGGNIASRVLPVRIHEINDVDSQLFEGATGGPMRSIDFIYKESGVNRPLLPEDERDRNKERIDYRNQLNKVANAVNEIIESLKGAEPESGTVTDLEQEPERGNMRPEKKKMGKSIRLPRFSRSEALGLALILFMAGFFLVLFTLIVERNEPGKIFHTSVLPPENFNFSTFNGANFEISPNGDYLAFIATDSAGRRSLWVRPLDQKNAYLLDGTDQARFPFWSPDSKQIGFFAEGELKKISVTGGGPVHLANVGSSPRGGSWGNDGFIIFTQGVNQPISKVPEVGGEPVQVTHLDPQLGERSHRWPNFMPDGQHFLFTVKYEASTNINDQIFLGALDSTFTPRLIKTDASAGQYTGGYLLFAQNQTLMAEHFDEEDLVPKGDPIKIADQLYVEPGTGKGAFSVSNQNELILQDGDDILDGLSQFSWMDREGNKLETISDNIPSLSLHVRLSPDDKDLVIGRLLIKTFSSFDLWTYGLDRSIWSKLTFTDNSVRYPVWTADGKQIIYSEISDSRTSISIRSADGSGDPELIYFDSVNLRPTDLSTDGKYLIFDSGINIMVLPMKEGKKEPYIFLGTSFDERKATFSPDVRWVAYQSNESGKYEVYIRPFEGSGKWKISRNGGSHPRWREDGKELFFLAGEANIMTAVEISSTGNSIELGQEETLFQFPSFGNQGADIYDVTRDGKKFLVTQSIINNVQAPLELIVNWKELLKEK